IIETMLKAGVDKRLCDIDNRTSFDYAQIMHHTKVIELLAIDQREVIDFGKLVSRKLQLKHDISSTLTEYYHIIQTVLENKFTNEDDITCAILDTPGLGLVHFEGENNMILLSVTIYSRYL
ncbi:unnamed protein product, partial [Didymodactylos carnosus]